MRTNVLLHSIIRAFSDEFQRQNPDGPSADDVFMVCFGLLMMSTDNTNRTNNRFGSDQFVRNMRGVGLSDMELQEIFQRSHERPMEMNEVSKCLGPELICVSTSQSLSSCFLFLRPGQHV
jgi:Sec7-like guanine-nucleotide exchange factor